MALFSANLKALSIRPPEQPSSTWSQSTNCCSLKDVSELPAIFQAPSSAPVVEKDQQDPHWPWFFTGVTAPSVVQSLVEGVSAKFMGLLCSEAPVRVGLAERPAFTKALHSADSMWENWLCPRR